MSDPRRPETVIVRDAHIDDLQTLVDIYNHYIATSHATFDIEPRTLADRRGWFAEFSPTGPYRLMVAETTERVVGYAYSARFRHRRAYETSVETTVYLDADYTGCGIGVELYGALLDRLSAQQGIHQAFAGVALPNPGSLALHEKLGFQLIGTFRDVGYKFGKFWSVSWFQKSLQP